jgi:hypothetical protein
MLHYTKVRIANYILILYYIHTSFISTLPAVKIRIISHFINFSFSLALSVTVTTTTYFESGYYPLSVVRLYYPLYIFLYLSGYSENKLPSTSLLYLCTEKIQPIISNSTREARSKQYAVRSDHFHPWHAWFVTGNAYNLQ